MKLVKILLVIISLSSCNKLKSGEVIEKWYEPEETNLVLMPLTISNGKTFTMVMIPYFITDNEDYVLKIKGVHKGKERIENVYVTKEYYQRVFVGTNIELGTDCSFYDENNQKVRAD